MSTKNIGRSSLAVAMEAIQSNSKEQKQSDLLRSLLSSLADCVTDPGARAWDDTEAAYRRLRAINEVARAAIAKATAND